MTPERYEQIGQIYHAVLERNPSERAAFLAAACGADETLCLEVTSLLDAHEQASTFIEQPPTDVAAGWQVAAVPPTHSQLAHYRLRSLLGKGGMGEVWLADDTQLHRQVAVKLLPVAFTHDAERVRRFAREARAVSALNHPNILTIYEIGATEGQHYLVTEYVAGETLRQRMAAQPPMPLADALTVAAQMAEALAAAHEAGIIHRDIKPENVMLRRDGYVKVLDFGLAKLLGKDEGGGMRDESAKGTLIHPSSFILHPSTMPGIVMGTPRYMSPEQARGEKVDARTDIFSLGVTLYEMVAGHAPFVGATVSDVIAAILKDEPTPLAHYVPATPPELQQIISQTLQKNRAERYQTANELLTALKHLKRQLERQDELAQQPEEAATMRYEAAQAQAEGHIKPTEELLPARTTGQHGVRGWSRRSLLLGGLLALLAAGGGGLYWRNAKLKHAQAALPRIEELAKTEQFFAAYDLAVEAQRTLPNDPTLARLMKTVADDLTVSSDPPGAQVYLKRFNADAAGTAPTRQLIGTTPLNHQQIARGTYLVDIEKPGYAGLERAVSGLMLRIGGMQVPSQPIRLEAKLTPTAQVPARMAFIPGGDYRLVGWSRPSAERVRLNDYFIDKYEVTNREYKEFISAGGYLKREFWRHFSSTASGSEPGSMGQATGGPKLAPARGTDPGHELAWEEAIRSFKDQTSLPGPRSWKNQEFPDGKAEHPVTDISWYEAAAYAAFRGKELPTVFQWEKAARNGLTMDFGVIMPWGLFTGREAIEPRANFGGRGTLPVESMEFGLSPFGCYHMAGNVAEWCRNQFDEGFAKTGGSWGDLPYAFGTIGAFPGAYTENKLGFRCVVSAPGATGEQGALALHPEADIPVYKPAGEASFHAWQEQYYRYEKPPLEAQIIERKETDDWRREKITYVGAGGERAIAWLYLPKNYAPPYQVIQLIPPGNVFQGLMSLDVMTEAILAPNIKSGRAVLAVVLKGFREREWPPNHTPPAVASAEYRDMVLSWITDERRALDYIATRSELDSTRSAYYSLSSDSSFKFALPSVEPRYRAVMLSGNCLRRGAAESLPEIHPGNLIPFIRAPKLLMHGRYDEGCRLKSEAEPLYKLMRGPTKLAIYNGGHILAQEFVVPLINSWLDEVMGPVRRP